MKPINDVWFVAVDPKGRAITGIIAKAKAYAVMELSSHAGEDWKEKGWRIARIHVVEKISSPND